MTFSLVLSLRLGNRGLRKKIKICMICIGFRANDRSGGFLHRVKYRKVKYMRYLRYLRYSILR